MKGQFVNLQRNLQVLKFYKTAQLMNKLYFHTNGRYFLPVLKFMVCVVVTFAWSASFKLSGKTDGFILICFGLYLLALTQLCALYALISIASDTYRLSKKIITKLKHGPLRLKHGKDLKALSPIGLRIGIFFVIKKSTPLLFFNVLSNCVITVLLIL